MDASQSEPTPAPHAQFDFADSDIALQSSDNVLFRVHKANLGAFSAVFRNMFSDAAGQGEPETVPVAETSSTLAILLAMCYPAEDPPVDFATLDARVVLACYEATVKYQMWVAGLALRSFVQPLVHLEPFLVVKLAHRLNDCALMTAAADETLNCDILANSQEYAEKAGAIVWPVLLEFHYRRKMEILVFASTVLRPKIETYHTCSYCNNKNPAGITQPGLGKLLDNVLTQGGAALDTKPFLKLVDDQGRTTATQTYYCPNCRNNLNVKQLQSQETALVEALNGFSPQSRFVVLARGPVE